MNPEYPVYVISKGRWEHPKTAYALERIGVPYHIVIEPQEYEPYSKVIDPSKILILPFSNLGQGSIPARNWVWEHSIGCGAQRHWILDDNIRAFFRSNNSKRHFISTGTGFRCIEIFTDRYTNIALSGMNYTMFVSDHSADMPAYYLNTRIYSCILINNSIPYRWRGRYNEDTDLSLRALKDGWCTVLFNAINCKKEMTLSMKGGNTDQLYSGKGRLVMAQSLVDQHPDLVTITWKYGRPQHQVYYKGFTQQLQRKPGLEIPDRINEYGMKLVYDNNLVESFYQRNIESVIKSMNALNRKPLGEAV